MAVLTEHKPAAVSDVEVASEEEGIMEMIVSVTGIKDRVNDIILPGAYQKSLKERTPKGVWAHSWTEPIAKTLDIKELMPGDPGLPKTLSDGKPWPVEAGALWVRAQFNLKGARGKQAFEDVKFFGSDAEFSIGYKVPPGQATIKSGVRHIKSLDVFEWSPVLFGAMPHARLMDSVKDAQEEWLRVKSIFGTCEDGEGTCCLSCGSAAPESKGLEPDEDQDRWAVTFAEPADDVPAMVGSFATKAMAEAWLEAYDGEEVGEIKAFNPDLHPRDGDGKFRKTGKFEKISKSATDLQVGDEVANLGTVSYVDVSSNAVDVTFSDTGHKFHLRDDVILDSSRSGRRKSATDLQVGDEVANLGTVSYVDISSNAVDVTFSDTGYKFHTRDDVMLMRRSVKSGEDIYEVKRFTGGWEEAKHPRDASGRFTDTPAEAAGKKLLGDFIAMGGSPSLDLLKNDSIDLDEAKKAYFPGVDLSSMESPVDPKAGRVGRDDGGFYPEDPGMDTVLAAGTNAQMYGAFQERRLGVESGSIQMILASQHSASEMSNPDDRLAWGKSKVWNGGDVVDAYDKAQDALTKAKDRRRDEADKLAKSLQLNMIAIYGPGWRERLGHKTIVASPPESKSAPAPNGNSEKFSGFESVDEDSIEATPPTIGGVIGAVMDDPSAGGEPNVGEGDPTELPNDEEAFADLEMLDDSQRSELLALAAADGVNDEAITRRLAIMIAETMPGTVIAGALAARVAPASVEGDGMPGVEKPGQTLAEARKQGAVGGKAKGKSIEDLLIEIKAMVALDIDEEGEITAAEAESVSDIEELPDEEVDGILGLILRDFMGPEDETKAYTFDPNLHPRRPDGKFAPRGLDGGATLAKPLASGTPGVGGLTADALVRAAQHVDRRTVPTRRLRRAIGRRFAPNWNSRAEKVESILARAQNRRASKSLAVLAATLGNATENLAPSERRSFIENDLGIDLDSLRSKAVEELRAGGATPSFVSRVENNIERTIQRQLGGRQKKDALPIDLDPDFAEVMAEAELNLKVASMTVDDVYEEMASMDPEALERLIEAVEGKVDEANPAGEYRARHLIRWFERGEGAAKIRWGTSGDFMRCVRIASKHLNPEFAKSFCNKRHQGAVGRPPGQGHKDDEIDIEQKALFDEWMTNDEWAPPVDLDVNKKSAEDALIDDMEQKDFCFGCDIELVDAVCPSCETTYDVKGLRRFVESMVRRNPDGEFSPKGGSGSKTQNVVSTAKAVARTHQDRKDPKVGDWGKTLNVLNDMAKDRGSLLHYMVDKQMAKRAEGGPGMEVDVHGPSGSISGRLGEVEPFQDALGLLRRVAEHNDANGAQGSVHVNLTDGTVIMTKGRKKSRLVSKIKQHRQDNADAQRRSAAAAAPGNSRLDALSQELDDLLRAGVKDDNVETEYVLVDGEVDAMRARAQLMTLDV